MQENRESILDGDVIASLRELNEADGPDLLVELVQLFLADTPRRIAEVDSALARGDHAALERAAHALKSSSANLGASGLSKIFRELESAGRNHDLVQAASLVRESQQEYGRVCDALRAEISA
jgi:HPt (histidine-containing phosphotransfer) domain-containing protein